jgi:hypothetical protein
MGFAIRRGLSKNKKVAANLRLTATMDYIRLNTDYVIL